MLGNEDLDKFGEVCCVSGSIDLKKAFIFSEVEGILETKSNFETGERFSTEEVESMCEELMKSDAFNLYYDRLLVGIESYLHGRYGLVSDDECLCESDFL